MTLSAGSKLGPYELLASLGVGGLGELYRARKARSLPGGPEGSCVLDYLSWSPDGKKGYYTVSRKVGDIFLLEGF